MGPTDDPLLDDEDYIEVDRAASDSPQPGSPSGFVCPDCGAIKSLTPCGECGHSEFQLGTSMALPGVFCQNCHVGSISWECPKCKGMKKTLFAFQYDVDAITVKKKRFWD